MIRILRVLIQSFYRPALGFKGISILNFRVGLTDLDFNFHMNNSKFLKLADLSRFDFILRTGIWRLMLKYKWQPVVGGITVRFRHSLSPFARFKIKTIIYGWDDKWCYFLHKFVDSHNRLVAVALSRAILKGKNGGVPMEKIVKLLHPHGASDSDEGKNLPAWVHNWVEADQEIYNDALKLAAREK